MPFGARWRSAAASQNGKGYLLFGRDENNYFRKELLEYNPESGKLYWKKRDSKYFKDGERKNATLRGEATDSKVFVLRYCSSRSRTWAHHSTFIVVEILEVFRNPFRVTKSWKLLASAKAVIKVDLMRLSNRVPASTESFHQIDK